MKSKSEKAIDVKARTEAHNKLSTQEKIDKARSRRGESKREIERLQSQL